jgi:hypothetical protein
MPWWTQWMLNCLMALRARPGGGAGSRGTGSARPSAGWQLDGPIFGLTPWDTLTTRDLCEGVLVMGNPGSGKTSTTGTAIPLAALRDGWGVVAYTTKPDDAAFWTDLCRRAGRSRQLRIVRPDGQTQFNIIRYELERTTTGGGNTLQLASLLLEAMREGKPNATPTESSEFFAQQGQILLCNAIDLLRLAEQPITFRSISKLIESAPRHVLDVQGSDWKRGECYDLLMRADRACEGADPARIELNDLVGGYFLDTFPGMNERTRGDILATIESALFQLNREPVRQLFDSPQGCSFFPEEIESGAVLVIDCPASIYGPVGRMLTICFKRLVKEMLRRRVLSGDATRPVLNFCDECQTYVTRDDADFQQVCRSNRVATVFLTQSIDNLEAVLGTDAHTNSLANALTTHIYHCTSGKTAEWIERRIAQAWRQMESINFPGHSQDQRQSPSFNMSEALQPQILASELTRLRTGGPRNGLLVDAVVFKPGRRFVTSNAPFARVQFRQE